jgi:hypothetical protein
MAEKDPLKADADTCGTVTLELDPALGVLSPGLLHAAATTTTVETAVVQASFQTARCKEITRFVPGQTGRPMLLGRPARWSYRYGSFQSISAAPWLTR